MAQTNSWSADRIKEIRSWKKSNNATWKEAAENFKVNVDALMRAAHYYKGKRAKSGEPAKRKYTKRAAPTPRFVDIQSTPNGNDERAVVVVCKVSQLKSVLGGLA